MKAFVALILWFVASAAPAVAQFNGAPSGFAQNRFASMSSSFVGDGDQVTGARAYYGVLAYNGSYAAATGKMLSVVRASDGHACDILSSTAGMLGNTANCGNSPDNGLSAASFCTATTCQVATAYDQSGNGLDVTQATSAAQPTLVFNCFGAIPCMRFLGTSTQKLAVNVPTTSAQPFTLVALARATHSTTGDIVIAGGNTFPTRISLVNTFSNGINGAAGTLLASAIGATVNTFLPMAFVGNNAASIMSVGGVNTTGPASTQPFPPSNNTPLTLGADGGNEAPLTGDIIVAGFWPAGFTTTQIASVCTNEQTNTGIPCYAGPGDVVQASITAYYGLSGYSSAVVASGTKAVNIVRASDGHACDVLLALNGGLGLTTACGTGADSGQTATAFCTSTSCAIATAYNQSAGSGGNATQATGANRPSLSFNCINTTLPCMTFSGSQWLSATATTGATATWSTVARRTANFTTQQEMMGAFGAASTMQNFFGSSTNTVGMAGALSQTVTATDGSFHTIQTAYNNTSSFIDVDGTITSLLPGIATTNTTVTLGAANGGGSQLLTGDIVRAGLWGSLVFTTTQSNNMCHLDTSYTGVSTSC